MEYNDLTESKMTEIAKEVANELNCGDLILLYGNLGTGKTFFTNKLCTQLGVETIVNSPSYVLLNEYEGKWKIYHYDLYRLGTSEEAIELGIIERLKEGITIIEWPGLIEDYLPKKRIEVYFEHNGDFRNIKIIKTEG